MNLSEPEILSEADAARLPKSAGMEREGFSWQEEKKVKVEAKVKARKNLMRVDNAKACQTIFPWKLASRVLRDAQN